MRRCAGLSRVLLLCAVVAGCAGPRAAAPDPAAAVPPSWDPARDSPEIAAASRNLLAAGEQDRPPLLLARARLAIAAGQRIRSEQGTALSLSGFAPGYDRFLACYDLAYGDLTEIAARPEAPQAPEAGYLLGLIHDYGHLDLFEEALSSYRLTVERFPGSPWAAKAAGRIEAIEKIQHGLVDSPHGR